MRRLNKKGFVQAITDTGIALIVIFIGLMLVILYANHLEQSQKDKGGDLLKEAHAKSLAAMYLKQELMVDGNKMSVSDLISIIGSESEVASRVHKKTLADFTNEFFSYQSFRNEYTGFSITVDGVGILDEHQGNILKRATTLSNYKQTNVASFTLPTSTGKPIDVIIYFEQSDYSVPEKSIQNAKAG